MKRFGSVMGAIFRGGEVLELIGDVGAGKTTLTKGIAAGMGIDEDIQSPSFTISRVYEKPDGKRLVHYDFYRLANAGIMRDEIAEDLSDPDATVVVEWADSVSEVLPEDRLIVNIKSSTEDSRQVELSGETELVQKITEMME